MSIEINVDYMVNEYDQTNNTIAKALGLDFEVFDINMTAEYTYHSGRPQTQYEPEEYSTFEIESYYIAGVYNDLGRFVPITKEQSEIILSIKPWVVDSDKLTDIIADSHTDKDIEDYRS
tara:strand:- start:1119 stop:1475 length:357 start_codon:yes stop_codon:yes gene_type:complete